MSSSRFPHPDTHSSYSTCGRCFHGAAEPEALWCEVWCEVWGAGEGRGCAQWGVGGCRTAGVEPTEKR